MRVSRVRERGSALTCIATLEPASCVTPDDVHPTRCVFPTRTSQDDMQAWQLTKDVVDKSLDDKVFRLSAALSYYSVFSLAPLLLIVISVAGAFFGEEAASGVLADTLRSSIGASAADAVQEMVMRTRKPSENLIASITGVLLVVVGATGVFAQLQDALNTVWSVEQKPGKVIKTLLRDRLQGFTMVLGIGFLLLTSLMLTAGLQMASNLIAQLVPIPPFVWKLLSSTISFLIVASLFGAIFRFLPDVEIEWKDVRFGAVLTAGLFVLGEIVLAWYLGRAATASVYGSAGSLVLILLWVNYASLILLLGAEFTAVNARNRGRTIRPSKGAVKVQRTTETIGDEEQPTKTDQVTAG